MTRRRRHQRGSIYLAVLAVAAIVAAIGIAAMMAVRLEGHVAEQTRDYADARACARSAIEMGAYWISRDPHWRTDRGNGVWASNVPVGDGTFTLEAKDPVDGDVTTGSNDPVILIGTGAKGDARYTLEVRFDTRPGLGALETALQAGHDIVIDASTVSSDQIISANHDIDSKSNSTIDADVQAVHKIAGAGYRGSTDGNGSLRQMPDPAHVLDYYQANGTAIKWSDLPLVVTNSVQNPGFENGTANWQARGITTVIAKDATAAHSGVDSLRVTGRASPTDGPVQDITDSIVNNTTYHLQAYVERYFLNVPGVKLNVTVQYLPTANGSVATKTWSTASQAVSSWTGVAGDLSIAWSGTLVKATVSVDTDTSLRSFRVDDVQLVQTGLSADRVIQNIVLGPKNNPFGTGATNAQGIYVIDSHGHRLIIRNSRIIGTLVILNPDPHSMIQGSVNWQPAVANYPALLSNGQLGIAITSTGLSESSLDANFNPTGAPYPYPTGSTNTTSFDAYPSRIRGLVYDTGQLNLTGSPSFDGVVLSNTDIQIATANVRLYYEPVYLDDPPPGFAALQSRMTLVRGSWQRVVH